MTIGHILSNILGFNFISNKTKTVGCLFKQNR